MNFLRKVFILLLACFLFHFKGHSQDSIRKGNWLTLEEHYGFIMPLYNSSMNILVQGHGPAMELD